VFERAKAVHASDRAATVIGIFSSYFTYTCLLSHSQVYGILKYRAYIPTGRSKKLITIVLSLVNITMYFKQHGTSYKYVCGI
jgi:hypothetical protein